MKKLKIKETYLLFLIVIGLVALSIYTTYAMFTASTEINNVVDITASLTLDTSIMEYDIVNLEAGETKIIEVLINNNYNASLYYGAWYEILTGTDLDIGLYTSENPNTASGTMASGTSKTILVGITNNDASEAIVSIGVASSLTTNLGLTGNKTLLPDGWTDAILVTDEYLNEHTTTITVSEDYTWRSWEEGNIATSGMKELTLKPGTYNLKVWGAQGGSYNTTYYGGKGGYSYGTLTLNTDTNIYAYVGGQGQGGTAAGTREGGYNGGGAANASRAYLMGSGGGASDIRIGTDSLYARVIVAGGGGGFGSDSTSSRFSGGAGGGTSGVNGSQNSTSYRAGTGGTATSAGTSYYQTKANSTTYGTPAAFGTGGAVKGTRYYVAGGGGGWYGGGYAFRASAGGGSGYVYTSSTASQCPSGCLLNSNYYLTNAQTVTGGTSFTDYNGSTVTGHEGDGKVSIIGQSSVNKTVYTVPTLTGIEPLTIKPGTSKNLTEGVNIVCSNGATSCPSEQIVSFSSLDTSTLPEGTYTVNYIVKDSNNIKYKYTRILNISSSLDNSGANEPDLVQGLIPVMYDGTNWVKANTTDSSSQYSWYDYDAKKWANAVLVTDTNRSTYVNASEGTTVPISDILAFYVWIPRYKYKVWNINKVIGTDSYNARTTGIDIVFENGKSSTGTVSCTYDFSKTPSASVRSENCAGSNGDYYTHPAFTFGNDELTGIWVGKFELSCEKPVTINEQLSITLTPRILPNVFAWSNMLSNSWKVIYDMQKSGNIYGLSTSRTNTDSHMMTNMEWGAVAYLTNSKYGRCTNNVCTEVSLNNSSWFYTGRSAGLASVTTRDQNGTYTYETQGGQLASTTGNIYGIYDMRGGAYEYVMGNMGSSGTTYAYFVNSAGSYYAYTGYEKYLTTYKYGTTYNDQTAYNRTRLGDAIGEIVTTSGETGGWYSDYSKFPASGVPWLWRGSIYADGINAGIFSFEYADGTGNGSGKSSRATLVGF